LLVFILFAFICNQILGARMMHAVLPGKLLTLHLRKNPTHHLFRYRLKRITRVVPLSTVNPGWIGHENIYNFRIWFVFLIQTMMKRNVNTSRNESLRGSKRKTNRAIEVGE